MEPAALDREPNGEMRCVRCDRFAFPLQRGLCQVCIRLEEFWFQPRGRVITPGRTMIVDVET